VKAGSWWQETVTEGLRAQEIAMCNRVPIVYLVDSAGGSRRTPSYPGPIHRVKGLGKEKARLGL